MAAKKIGAIIALDGEKQFKQAVTSCNKSLTALKSEMSLVKAESEGQANSLENLRKKHSVLEKVLEEQNKKQNEVNKGLENAQRIQKKVADGLETLRTMQVSATQKVQDAENAYQAASKRLDEMTISGKASQQEIKQQQEEVDKLSAALKDEQKALEDVNAALKKGERNYETAGNKIKDWETKLNTAKAQVIKATAELNKNAAYMREAEQATDHCATSIDGFGKEVKAAEKITFDFATVIKTNLQNALVDFAKNAVSEAIEGIVSFETAQHQLQASTGATSAEMRQYSAVMESLHVDNYGEDINDIAQAMSLVRQYTGEIDTSKLEDMTKNGIAMRDVFGMDLSEAIRGTDALMRNMGLASEEAFDLMAKGAQNGLDKSGELADNIAEYSQLWAQAGFSAEEMFAVMDNGLKSGAYNLDKVNDFVKEFTISLADGRIERNLENFSMDTQRLFREWEKGEATAKDVFYSVINDLSEAENQQQALTLASETWSALGEDNAMRIITSLDDVNTAYDDVRGTMEDIQSIKYDTLESRLQKLGKRVQTEIGVPVGEVILPMLEDGLDLVIDNMDALIPIVASAGTAFATFKVGTLAVQAMTTATEGATVATGILNAVCNANPFVLLATAVIGAGTALITYAANAGEASAEVDMLTESNDRAVASARAVTEAVGDSISEYHESSAEIAAQSKYVDALIKKIDTLSGSTELSNEEVSVMKEYIAELNNLVPGLNASYDAQAKKLNITAAEMSRYNELSRQQTQNRDAQEHAIELIKQRSELEVENARLQSESEAIEGKRNDILAEHNDLIIMSVEPLTAWITGLADERTEYKNLTKSLDENKDALEENEGAKAQVEQEIEVLKAQLEAEGISWDTVTDAMNEASATAEGAAGVHSATTTIMYENAAKIAETYTSLKTSVSESLESQMDMFDEFDAGTEISTQQLLANMQSQIDGVTQWADNMSVLADRGINQNLLSYLAEMGPQGAGYVAAFAQMTDEELQKASAMWSESLDMKQGVSDSINGMLESVTTTLSGGKEVVSTAMQEVGASTIEGLALGIQNGTEDVAAAGNNMSEAVIGGAKEGAGVHSPSTKTREIGRNINQGLILGIKDTQSEVTASIKDFLNTVIKNMSTQMRADTFNQFGQQVTNGIEMGIQKGQPKVVSVSRQLAEDVHRNVSNIPSLYSAGLNVAVGLASGISAGRSSVISAVANLCQAAINQANAKLKIHSPSRVFAEIGEYTAEGFGVGYERKIADVRGMIDASMEYRYNGFSDSVAANAGIARQGLDNPILELLSKYIPVIAENWGGSIVLDDGTLVGRMMPKINKGLNNMKIADGRGAV